MTVKPAHFVQSMRKRWAEEYGLTSSKALEQAWREMAVTFNEHIEEKVGDTWSVLRLPTGSGKTQGLALYCSLLSEVKDHPGVLVITKFTGEIDDLVGNINQAPYKATALAEHGELKVRPTLAEIRSAPVLAITHSMYQKTLDATAQQEGIGYALWKKFAEWEYGSRKLIVIDEALNVIEPVYMSHDLLRIVRGWIPRWMEIEHPGMVGAFDKIIAQFCEWEKKHPKEYDGEIVSPDFWQGIPQADIAALCDALCKLPLSRMIKGQQDNGQMAKRCEEVFFDILYAMSNQSWYERKRGAGVLNTAYVALPTHIRNVVVMDATARQSMAYELLGSIPHMRPLPKDVRNYENVRLHVLYGYQNSAYHLKKSEVDEQHFVDVVDALSPVIPRSAKFLFVTHKDVCKKLSKVKKKYRNCKKAYWGGINGKNEWSDCTALVMYGLPRLDEITPQSSILAFKNWHKKTKEKHFIPAVIHEEMPDGTVLGYVQRDVIVNEETYHHGHIASEVIQAINRVQCRRITESNGGCDKTDIYLLLNTGDEMEKAVLEAIEEEMTGIKIIPSCAPSVQRKKVRSKLGQEIINRLRDLPKQDYPALDLLEIIQKELGFGSSPALKAFAGNCRDENSPEAKAVAEVGYRYAANSNGGRSNKGVFSPL